ncbi:ubiquitin C-terminal hydrolase-like protein [Mollisia scopiformis]|uniref:ubiquitinyl hydrolase 1 n=1 Tax=Mollisia scopiformis TaxID=149040 RepID=A0A194WSI2_MOLSC|nr:ubiquitin C-terminal hydrolase-like protein [Mollisia scopiformis]KUJ10644.1 ubiquitin C-terminal hydrolase-like protein [Mollisia scopiformis]
MDDREIPLGPGKTAPRLIIDLLDYDPRYPVKGGWNVLADFPPVFREGQLYLRKDLRACHHSLCKKEAQTNAPISNDQQPDRTTQWVVSTYCTRCRYHFKVSIDLYQRRSGQEPCHLLDPENPLHHFRLVESIDGREYKEKHGPNKYDLLTEAHRFVCTGSKCPAVLEIRVSPPRLPKNVTASIMDPAIVYTRGQREIKNQPERYAGQTPVTPSSAIGYLRQYLSDAKTTRDTGEVKKIARRNKKYMLAFADECDALFNYLDFRPIEEPGAEPGEEAAYFWQLPTITDSNRHFLEDVVIELDMILQGRPQSEKQASNITRYQAIQPLPALKDIERSLGYYDYPKRSRTVDLSAEEHPHYQSLGAVDCFTDTFLEWAYDRQRQCDPFNKPYYLDCLTDIAKGRDSSDLQMRVVMAESANEYGLKTIESSYKFFGLDADTREGDDHIMGLYKSRIESAPRQKDEARQCLLVIAKHRDSEKIEALANDRTMSFEEALDFLNVNKETASDSIEAAAVAVSLDGDKSRVAKALQVIAKHRGGDFTLSRAAAQMENGGVGSDLDIGDAYSRLQINNRTVPDETIFAYYQSLTQGACAPGSKDSYTQALRTIALERSSDFLLRKIEDPNADVQASTAEPVGLDNIGNTCYLNSLLQYYYTVKPVRDMVIDFENYRMPLTVENIKNKRVGGRIVAKSEIEKAQKFVAELHNLFENLKTASSRSVKPTRELAELTIFSSLTEANFRRASISSPSGPPNIDSIMNMDSPIIGPQWPPPREASQTSSMTAEDDIEMVDRPGEKQNEASDDSSEATLVDMDQLPSYDEVAGDNKDKNTLSDEKKNQSTNHTADLAELEGDAVMVNGETSPVESPQTMTAPEKPPPIPPRNKSGLVISTTESKDLIPDDDLWRFGTQQDVTEVIGNVTFRMQCAIKPTSIEEDSGEQIDIIRDTFFGSSTTYTQKAQSLEKKVEAWPTIIVYPGKGVIRDIYEAIDVVFDEQRVEVDNTVCPQYSCISKLPPVLQIQIQRTDYDKDSQRSSKNRTAVTFPETIYLDRYVDTGDPNSMVMKRRRETWRWKEKLRKLEARQEALKNAADEIPIPEALLATKDLVNTLQEAEVEDIEIFPSLPELLDERLSEVTAELENISGQIQALKQSLRDQFTDMRQYEYKLHSVFIHRGEAGGGHYWVYIYDFEHDIWREYNDEYVTEVKDRRRIFDQQGGAAGGTPYYLVYVRSSDKQDLVDAVCRDVQEIQMTDLTETRSDINMVNGADFPTGDVEHIERANPRPLRPKPVSNTIGGSWDDPEWLDNQPAGAPLDANGRQWG